LNILVTGGAGFIGSHLCEKLTARGDRVVALDNFDPFYAHSLKEKNVASLRILKNFSLVEGDIRSNADLDLAFGAGKIDAVVHLAALAGVRPSIEEPARYQDVNVGGTTQILEAMRRHGVKKMVFGSSSSVYGNNEKVPFAEDDPVDHPISPYAATKKACELMCHAYHHLFGLDIFCLRFFTVYGPRQRPDLAIHKFARILREGGSIPMFGDGTTRRDYTYVDDIVQGVLAALEKVAGYRIYNLGESQTTELRELIRLIAASLGVEAKIERLPLQAGDVEQTYADISRARSELGYRPTTKVAEGIPRFIKWFRENGG
jgi:UDP-glucuronate 4-epimerase